MITIDFVAPPFAGHLFPAIQLARGLSERGIAQVRILSTAGAQRAAETAGLNFVDILPGRDADVWAIANTTRRVGSNPIRLWSQLRSNLALMSDLQSRSQTIWSSSRPDLAIVDFVVPVAGLTAQQMGVRWWTGMPTPCALETQTGTPSYLGGWRPSNTAYGRIRDYCGRHAIKTFKQATSFLFNRELRALDIHSLYRPDGTEVIYSDEQILGYGMREFEFERDWPQHFKFVGPLFASPFPANNACLEVPGVSVLISLGTHLQWAKGRALKLLQQVARRMPEVNFHISQGNPGSTEKRVSNNIHIHDSLPYTPETLRRFSAAVIHGGTGITYACIEAGVPMLVWPQDYDQFDHAARIVHHGLGRRCRPTPKHMLKDLTWLLNQNAEVQGNFNRFKESLATYNAVGQVAERLQNVSIKKGK